VLEYVRRNRMYAFAEEEEEEEDEEEDEEGRGGKANRIAH